MKRPLLLAAIAALAVYSIALVGIELATSQAYVRHYVTDIQGPVRFYAINTTLSVGLVWAAALLFAVVLLVRGDTRPWTSDAGRFHLSQIAILGYLGFDDRFLVHETVALILDFPDALLVGGIGVVQLALLWRYREVWDTPGTRRALVTAALAFALMSALDLLAPSEMTLRLSLEDVSKTWAAFALAWFAWEHLRREVDRLRRTPTEQPPAEARTSA